MSREYRFVRGRFRFRAAVWLHPSIRCEFVLSAAHGWWLDASVGCLVGFTLTLDIYPKASYPAPVPPVCAEGER